LVLTYHSYPFIDILCLVRQYPHTLLQFLDVLSFNSFNIF
jgi:hypothetical protein